MRLPLLVLLLSSSLASGAGLVNGTLSPVSSTNGSSLSTNVALLNTNQTFTGQNTFTSPTFIGQFGSATGNGTSIQNGSPNIPIFTLAGNPTVQGTNNLSTDFTAWIKCLNPYSSGAAMSLQSATINSNSWTGGVQTTNSDGDLIGYTSIYPSFVLTSLEGPVGDLPGVTQIVNNGTPIAITSVQSVAGSGFSGGGNNIIQRTNWYVFTGGILYSNITKWSNTTIYSTNFFTNGQPPKVVITGGGTGVSSVVGNYPAFFFDPYVNTDYLDIPIWQPGVFYPTSPLWRYLVRFDQVHGTLDISTNFTIGKNNTSGAIVKMGPNGNALNKWNANNQVTYLNLANSDGTDQVNGTNFVVPQSLNGGGGFGAGQSGFYFSGGSGMVWDGSELEILGASSAVVDFGGRVGIHGSGINLVFVSSAGGIGGGVNGSANNYFDPSYVSAKEIMTSDYIITASGSTGAKTINKSAGSIRIAAAGSSVVLTDSYITTNSVVTANVATHDTTAYSVQCVPTTGSCTFYLNAAATSETEIRWLVNTQ